MRIVRTAEGVRYDPTGKTNGRGAYIHDKRSCWERALKGSLANALKIELTQMDIDHLTQVLKELENDEG
jgi:uncharacterized protein